MKLKKVKIFCDGACKYNPGPGGWAAILKYKNYQKTISGFSKQTTNNIMELTAVIKALEKIKEKCEVGIFSDSKYVIWGMTDWIQNWKKMEWKRKNKKPIKNLELWKNLDELCSHHKVKWSWIQGHIGHPENEKCDTIAKMEIEKQHHKSRKL